MRSSHARIVFVLLLLFAAIPTSARVIIWNGQAPPINCNGNWNNVAHWQGGAIPGPLDTADIRTNCDNPYTVTYDGSPNPSVINVLVGAPSQAVTLVIQGGQTLNLNGVGPTAASLITPNGYISIDGSVVANLGHELDIQGGIRVAGLFDFSGPINLSGLLDFNTGGTIRGPSGTLTIAPSGQMIVIGTPPKQLQDWTITNFGFIKVQSIDLQIIGGNGAKIINDGTIDFQTDGYIEKVDLDNRAGIVKKTGGSSFGGFSQFTYIANGTFQSFSGVLKLAGDGSGNGTFEVASGAIEFVSGIANTFTGPFTGSGAVLFSGTGAFAIAGPFQATDVIIDGPRVNFVQPAFVQVAHLRRGEFGGSGDLQVAASFLWLEGQFTGTGKTVLLSSANAQISGGGAKQLGRTLENHGDLSINSTTDILCFGSAIQNFGAINFATDVAFDKAALTNNGTILKTGSAGVGGFTDSSYVNDGSMVANTGTLLLFGNGNGSGSFQANAGATIAMVVGAHDVSGPIGGAGALEISSGVVNHAGSFDMGVTRVLGGSLRLNGPSVTLYDVALASGALEGSSNFGVQGQFDWTGGSVGGPGLLQLLPSAVLTVHGASTKTLGRPLRNEGIVILSEAGAMLDIASSGGIENVGTIEFSNDAIIFGPGVLVNNQGTVTKSAGAGTGGFQTLFTNVNGQVLSRSGALLFDQGFNQLGGVTTLDGGNLEGAAGATFQFDGGELRGRGIIVGHVTNNAAFVRPGLSPGVLRVNGNYSQNSPGVLEIELAGTAPGSQHDQLDVAGGAALGGTLNVILIGGYTPSDGDVFEILRFASRSGDFAQKNGLTFGTNGTLVDSYTANSMLLTASIPQADLSLAKVDLVDPVPVGSDIEYKLTVSNAGPDPATDVIIVDTLPAGTTLVSTEPPGACAPIPGTVLVECRLGTVAVGANPEVKITVSPSAPGTYTNTANVRALEFDPNNVNNDASADTAVGAAADLSIVKRALASSIFVGENVTFSLKVRNIGPSPASGVLVNDKLPPQLTFVSADAGCTESGGTVVCDLGSLKKDEEREVFFVAKGTVAAVVTNTASVRANEGDQDTSNNQSSDKVTIKAGVDLQVVKTGSKSTASSGESIRYEIVVTNRGGAPANNVVVIDILPLGAVVQDARASVGTCNAAEVVACQISRLNPSDSATIVINAILNGVGVVTNRASAEASEPDSDPQNNSSSFDVNLGGGITGDLSVVKTGPTSVAPGDGITYTIRVTNSSSSAVSGVRVRDDLPSAVSGIFWSCAASAGSRCGTAGGSGNLDQLVDLAANGLVTITIGGSVSEFATGKLTNTATLTLPAGFTDSNPGNNTSKAESTLSVSPCQPGYQVVIGVVPELESRQPIDVEIDNPLEAGFTEYEVQLASNNAFTDAETKIASLPSPGAKPAARFTRTVEAGRRKFFARARALACHPEQYSQTGEVVVFAIPTTTMADPQLKAPLGTTQAMQANVTIPGNFFSKTALDTTVTITTDKSFVTVTPANVTVPPQGANVQVNVNPVGLPVGTTTGTMVVTNTGNGVSSAVPISITLVGPVTPVGKTPAPANALIVPVVGFAQGVNSKWISDLRITNTANIPIQYQLILTPSQTGADQSKQATLTLLAGQTVAFDNVAERQFGIGSLGESGSGVLEIRPLNFSGKNPTIAPQADFLATVASSFTYNQAANGTLGQFIPALPFSSAVRKPTPSRRSILSLQHIAQNAETRTNIGFVEGSGQPATVQLRVFNNAGQKLDEFTVSLEGGEHKQLNALLALRNLELSEGRIEMEVISPTGQILGYASVVESATNDPLFVPGVDLSQATSNRFIVPGVVEEGTEVATDLRIFNGEAQPVEASFSFFRAGESTPSKTVAVTIAPGEVKTLDNVVSQTFGEANVTGTVQITTPSPAALVVTGRSRRLSPAGVTSQFISARSAADAAGASDRPLQILQLEESERFRSDLGVVEVTGSPVTLEISGTVPDGKSQINLPLQLQGNEMKQLSSVLQQLQLGRAYNARVSIRVVSGSGKILAYGSVRDLKSGDTTFIPAQ